jgi:hypothetical protein
LTKAEGLIKRAHLRSIAIGDFDNAYLHLKKDEPELGEERS